MRVSSAPSRSTNALHTPYQADGLNVTNHVQFGGLGTSLASSQSFGTISGQNNGSRDLQLAAKINF